MKKYIIGGLVGFLLAVPFTAFGEQLTNIGKKVQEEYDVMVDGEKLPVKAISIDGTTYTPNRTLSEALDYDITFADNTVVYSRQSVTEVPTPVPVETPTESGDAVATEPVTQPVTEPASEQKTIELQILDLDRQIREIREERDYIAAIKGLDKPLSEADQKKVDELKVRIVELQKQKVALQKLLEAQQ